MDQLKVATTTHRRMTGQRQWSEALATSTATDPELACHKKDKSTGGGTSLSLSVNGNVNRDRDGCQRDGGGCMCLSSTLAPRRSLRLQSA